MSIYKIYKPFRDVFWTVMTKFNPVYATKLRCRKNLGYEINLTNPKTLNEKLNWLKLFEYRDNEQVTICSDKYKVRDFVSEKGLDHLLLDLYGVWDRAEDIDWKSLPEQFVLKCNHGSGGNIICHDKSKLNKNECVKLLNKWLKDDYGPSRVEFSYEHISRKIIAEELIKTSDGLPPKDYKVFCSYGNPKLLFVASERGEDTKFDYFTPEWEWIPVKNSHKNAKVHPEKPKQLNEMLEHAKTLTQEFPLVRVDFYIENESVIFGEITFLHFGGVRPFVPSHYDREFGDLFPIDELVSEYNKGKK